MSKRILLVEDNSVQSLMFKKMVEEYHHEVIDIVDRGEKAVTKAIDLQPDLMIMDIFLNGDMSGIQAMQIIRKKGKEVPVIFVSGNSDSYYVRRAEQITFSKFLFKPVKQRDLLDAMQGFLGTNGKQQSSSILDSWIWPFSLT